MMKMVQKYSKFILIIFTLSLLSVSCSNNKFKIKGEVYGGENKSIVLEKSDFQGRWLAVDSTRINGNGGFSFSFPAPVAPDIYRLSLNNQYIYIPIDSVETISLTTSYDKFGRDFSLEGSKNAEMLAQFEKKLQNTNTSNPDSLNSFKRFVFSNYMKDFPGSILGFYILTKTIDNTPLYNPSDNNDRKYFAAVATGYQAVRPNDPHASLLEQTALQAMKQKNNEIGNYRTIEANEIALIDMDLQDENGNNIKLSSVTGQGKPVVVIFSLLNVEDSPQLNIALSNVYKKHAGKVEFYNVSLDSDQYAWREAAKNLPWITVYSPGGNSSVEALQYNVSQIPSFYIYNASGELSSRPLTIEELDSSL